MSRDWIREMFIENAGIYLRVLNALWSRGERDAEAVAALLRRHGVEPGSEILDLGCGNGRVAVPLAKRGYRVVGVDVSEAFIEDAWRKAREHGVEGRVDFRVCDARELTKAFEENEFDAVLCVWSTIIGYGSREDDYRVLREAWRVTRRDGFFMLLDHLSREQAAVIYSFTGNHPLFSEVDEGLVEVQHMGYDPLTGAATTKWAFYEKRGDELRKISEVVSRIKLYSLPELVELAREAGWKLVAVYGDKAGSRSYRPALDRINAVFQAAKH